MSASFLQPAVFTAYFDLKAEYVGGAAPFFRRILAHNQNGAWVY
jgi:hypothetical protein